MTKTITTTTTITTVTTHDDMPAPPPPQPGLRPLAAQYFRMVQPLIGRGILLRNYAAGAGVITVSVRRTHPDAVRFYCKVSAALAPALTLPATIDYSQPDPADLVRLTRVGTTEYFTASNVAVAGVPAAMPTDPNQQIIVGAYSTTGQLLEPQNFAFIAIPQIPLSVRVNAKGCLFFAYAGAIPGAILPHAPQEKLPDNLPTFVVAPIDGAGVTVSVPKKDDGTDQQWTNEHGLVNADGQAGDNDTTVDAYRSSYLGSQYMKRLGIEIGKNGVYLDGLLTGMWDFGRENSADPLACVQLKIGVGPTPLEFPSIASPTDTTAEPLAPLFLLLGLHMDDNWNQSAGKPSGCLNVTLSWV